MRKMVNEGHLLLPLLGNSIAEKYPELAKEWDYNLNFPVTPDKIMPASNKYAHWKCRRGHSYIAVVNARTQSNTGCPYCSGRLPIYGKTDFATKNPYWAERWDYDRNKDTPEEITWCSSKKRYFRCDKCQGSFEMAISHINRTIKKTRHCPYCANLKLLKGNNDLASVYPQLIQYWDQEQNSGLRPEEIIAGGKTKYWWKCENGFPHSFLTTIPVRAICGCPYCARTKVLEGFNDLQTTHPSIAEEWDLERNGELRPSGILSGSDKKAWWKCPECGKSYSMAVSNRIAGHGCRECKNRFGTSLPEQTIYYYVKKAFPDAVLHYSENKNELDVFVPSLRIGIEYDGLKYHNTPRKYRIDQCVNEYFEKKGIEIIRVREEGLPKLNGCKIYSCAIQKQKEALTNIIGSILSEDLLKTDNIDIDIGRDYQEIYASYKKDQGTKSLAYLYPELVTKQWDYALNAKLLPTMVTPGNEKIKCWWHCSKGHQFDKCIYSMVKSYNNKSRTEGCRLCLNGFLKEGRLKKNDIIQKISEK